MPHYAKLNFRWIPNQAIDATVLDRMRENFPMPDRKPPVSLFNRPVDNFEYYEDVENYPDWNEARLQLFLDDINTGILSFGRFKVWVDWFHHMLPHIITEASTTQDYEFYNIVIELFFSIYDDNLYEEYLGFHQDVFNTLMQIIMLERHWQDNDINRQFWLSMSGTNSHGVNATPLAITLQFCIKYLPAPDLPEWIESITKIEGKIWKLQVKYWLTRFKNHPYNYNVPDERIKLFFDEIRQYAGYENM